MPDSSLSAPASAYLELLKRSLLNEIYADHEYSRRQIPAAAAASVAAQPGEIIAIPRRIDPEARELGRIWPPSPMAHSMIGRKRLDNIQHCVERVVADAVPGDLIETGVWRGGATIFMRGCLLALADEGRRIWVADSFEGLPAPDPQYSADAGDVHHTYPELAISLEQVKENFARYALLDSRVEFLKGWFKDTLPAAPLGKLAIMRLDGDMYGSTMDALTALYDKLSPGGFVIIDDYCLPPCQQAVADFRESRSIRDEIVNIDDTGAFWRRT
ncbi:TylF/MycF family methyltransferase [Bosea sp. BH3]|uniref:TylF/MycF family methyltransferase n=1 Tax=Bosea sp. BH3 TaxID=2871701 RepID=UPI0021CB8E32|nr:TylF/MycF family methyltransferase [Bosea sp. BH3]MCU4181250.1 TylF/MycF family methyltransferase [Bosea sp. BH3]